MTDVAQRGNARGRVSRARLLDAATACFGERGYAATRVADITAAAGMSQGGFYRHFKDKNDILIAALEEPLAELHAVIDPLGDPGAAATVDLETISAIHTAFFRAYAKNRRVTRVLREAAALQEPGLAELWLDTRGRYLSRIERWLRGLQAAGTLDAPDIVLLAEALGAVLDQLAYTRLGLAEADPTAAEIQALGAVTSRLWVAAVRAA